MITNPLHLIGALVAALLLVAILDLWREYHETRRRRYYVRLLGFWLRVPRCLFERARRGRWMTKYFKPYDDNERKNKT